jgi:alpha-N-acetylglucosaminidase
MRTILLAACILPALAACAGNAAEVRVTPPHDAAGVGAARALVARVTPRHADQFICEIIPKDGGKDVFEIESVGGKVHLRGNNGVSLATALNWYLKYTANCEFSQCGEQMKLPARLPQVAQKTHIAASVPYRFMFNYCVYGYTSPWWGWERWERELDWMAMNGINLPFIVTGQEAVWIKTFARFGYTEEEIRKWLGSPAHFPWLFMQNMHSFGGELPAEWIAPRMALAQKIIGRARELGMNTVLQGWYGMLPVEFAKKHPDAKVLPQGKWAGGLERPDMLDPTDPLFEQIAGAFMEEQEKLYGRAGFYAADPFHEGGNSKGVDLADCGRRVFAAMTARDPQAIWIKQCWQSANAATLSSIPADRVIALDLHAETKPFWKNGAFNGKSWIWNQIVNFGGNTGINADLPHLAEAFPKAMADPKKGKLVGMGLVPEGTGTVPAVYALTPELPWRAGPVDLEEWIPAYARRRYGADSRSARKAWEGLLKTVYAVPGGATECPFNSPFEMRPIRGKARESGAVGTPYDAGTFAAAWKALLAAAPECGASDAYRYDLVDVTRQLLGDLAKPAGQKCQEALAKNDAAAFANATGFYLGIMTDMDRVLSTRREFLFGAWIRDARAWGTTPQAKDLHEYQARTLLTTWDDHPGSNLNDYACRSWSGLVQGFYRERWKMLFDAQAAALKEGRPCDNEKVKAQLAAFEKAFVHAHERYPEAPVGDTVQVVREVAQKYAPFIAESWPNAR